MTPLCSGSLQQTHARLLPVRALRAAATCSAIICSIRVSDSSVVFVVHEPSNRGEAAAGRKDAVGPILSTCSAAHEMFVGGRGCFFVASRCNKDP